MDVLDLARELIGIESTSGREGRVGAVIADRLAKDGWSVVKQPLPGGDPEMKEPRANVLATDGHAPELVFTTHLDTVPPYVPLREDAEHLYGRGTCDAKGIFAAEWAAAEILRSRGHRGIALLGVVAEETDSMGAKRAQEILPRARWIVDGEPTGLVMTSAAKGIYAIKVRAEGVAGHSAYPERGRSAVHALLRALARVLEARLPEEQAFGATTVNVGRVEGGAAANVIAPSAEALVMVRVAAPLEEVKRAVDGALGPEVTIEVLSESAPLRIHMPPGYEGTPVAFGSDVPHLSNIGTPMLVGPGSIHDAHTAGEKIGKQELLDAVKFYVDLGERLLAKESR